MLLDRSSTWAFRFGVAGIVHGSLAVIAIILWATGLPPFVRPQMSWLIYIEGYGIWFALGYATYIILGVAGAFLMSALYRDTEKGLGKKYTGTAEKLAWLHLILMNVGIASTSWLMMVAGDAAMLPPELCALIHPGFLFAIVIEYPTLMTISIASLVAGIISGALGYRMTRRTA
ncbi:MAG: hypothetical protein NZ988_05090 [Thaumarchaeota archaeon]|nr:hypothetical protein [Candidatus Calditenuaceae archaeon]MDW8187401.1 hypothetical protein [Nitrososphaerota archaeon]